MERAPDDRTQRDATITAGQEIVDEELTTDEAHDAHRKEGADAVHSQSGERQEIGREGGRTDHLVTEDGETVPRDPQG